MVQKTHKQTGRVENGHLHRYLQYLPSFFSDLGVFMHCVYSSNVAIELPLTEWTLDQILLKNGFTE